MNAPEALSGTLMLFGFGYPAYRFAIIAAGLAVAGGLYWLIHKTRIGMLIRAGATDASPLQSTSSAGFLCLRSHCSDNTSFNSKSSL